MFISSLAVSVYSWVGLVLSFVFVRLVRIFKSADGALPQPVSASTPSLLTWVRSGVLDRTRRTIPWTRAQVDPKPLLAVPGAKSRTLTRSMSLELLPISAPPPPPSSLPSTPSPPPLVDFSITPPPRTASPLPPSFRTHPIHPRPLSPHALLATTPPPRAQHRRSRSLGGVPVRRLSGSPTSNLRHVHQFEVEMRDLGLRERDVGATWTSREHLLIDLTSSLSSSTSDEVSEPTKPSPAASDLGLPPAVYAPPHLNSQPLPLVDISSDEPVQQQGWTWLGLEPTLISPTPLVDISISEEDLPLLDLSLGNDDEEVHFPTLEPERSSSTSSFTLETIHLEEPAPVMEEVEDSASSRVDANVGEKLGEYSVHVEEPQPRLDHLQIDGQFRWTSPEEDEDDEIFRYPSPVVCPPSGSSLDSESESEGDVFRYPGVEEIKVVEETLADPLSVASSPISFVYAPADAPWVYQDEDCPKALEESEEPKETVNALKVKVGESLAISTDLSSAGSSPSIFVYAPHESGWSYGDESLDEAEYAPRAEETAATPLEIDLEGLQAIPTDSSSASSPVDFVYAPPETPWLFDEESLDEIMEGTEDDHPVLGSEIEAFPDPGLLPLPLPDVDLKPLPVYEVKEVQEVAQTPTPPASPPARQSLTVEPLRKVRGGRSLPPSPRVLTPPLIKLSRSLPLDESRPLWSQRADEAPALGLAATPEETLSLPGSFPETVVTPVERDPVKAVMRSRSVLDIALAMQLRPGLGAGADPAWMVRFLMSMFGWIGVAISGQYS